jgi:hypothetical protein
MLPSIVSVLKFRIKYNLNLNNDILKLKKSYLNLNYIIINMHSELCKNFIFFSTNLSNIYKKQYLGCAKLRNSNIIKLFRL